MRQRWIYIDGSAIPAEEFEPAPSADYHIMGDIEPFQSMCDGSMIMGRRQKRENYKMHNVIEVGDQVHHLKPYGQYQSPKGLKESVIREVYRAKEAQRNGRKYGGS